MQPQQIFINRNNQKHGPYTLDDVNDYLASGHLLPSDAAWFEGTPAWMPLSQVPNVKLPHVRVPPPPLVTPAPAVPVPQQKVRPKSAINTYGGGCLLIFFGFSLVLGMIGSFQDKQKEQKAQTALVEKQRQERAAARKRAAVIAVNPKLAAAEREKVRREKEEHARKADQAKRERETAEKKTREVVVENSAFDGAVPQVVDYLKQTLRDFNSAEWIEWSEVEKVSGKPYKFRVRCKYRAENGFGGKTIANQIFLLDSNGQVINVIDLE